jgi:CheY-like chemotaxis protein
MDSQLSVTHFRILLADDDKDDRFFFKKALNSLPGSYSLEMVADGEELMDYLNKNCHHLPDVIFLDINMPRKNGIECLEEIKQDERLCNVPVVIYSTSGFNSTAKALYEQGAHYYFQKCDYFELVTSLEEILTALKKKPERPSASNFFFRLQVGK